MFNARIGYNPLMIIFIFRKFESNIGNIICYIGTNGNSRIYNNEIYTYIFPAHLRELKCLFYITILMMK